ncbi:MAG: alkaline phosphatase family protein [Candidatus Bathyarchaeota archaeon]|nr:MAG: alkaline phosphatase family protein [Candidatus Bathyarchaeota archaeon]
MDQTNQVNNSASTPAQPDRSAKPVLLVCIDGLSWELATSLFNQGLLPHLQRLVHDGVSGQHPSIKPLISPRIWASIYTGKTPEKHGIFDFYDDQVQSKQIWEILHDAGETVGVFNPLTLFDAQPVNGFQVPGTMARQPSAYPEELTALKNFAIDVRNNKLTFSRLVKYTRSLNKIGCRLTTLLRSGIVYLTLRLSKGSFLDTFHKKKRIDTLINTDIFLRCFKQYSPTFAVFYDNGIDLMSHRYWKYMDPEHPEHSKYGTIIKNYYRLIDRILGTILAMLTKQWTVLVISDHGFQESHGHTTYDIATEKLLLLLGLQDSVYAIKLVDRFFFRPKQEAITTDEISTILQSIVGINGEPLFNITHDQEYVQVWGNHSVITNSTSAILPDQTEIPVQEVIAADSLRSGTHQENGVVFITGPDIRTGEHIENISVYDIAPTILAIKNMPIPTDMDGQVLQQIFTPETLGNQSLQSISSYETESKELSERRKLTTDEEENIKARLQELGYL